MITSTFIYINLRNLYYRRLSDPLGERDSWDADISKYHNLLCTEIDTIYYLDSMWLHKILINSDHFYFLQKI